jgi:adenosylcobinamide-GDP ribazoletransferase
MTPPDSDPPPSPIASTPPRHRLVELCLAVTTLTRLPLPCPAAANRLPIALAAWAFPLAGFVVGAVGAGVYAGSLGLGLPLSLAAIAAIAAMVWLTGGLHEDGLADCADGFGGGRNRDGKLAIMRDSRLGTYGALALMLALLARMSALTALDNASLVGAALIGAAVASRTAVVALMTAMHPARRDGLAATAGQPPLRDLAIAVAVAVVAAIALLGFRAGLYGLAGAALGAALVAGSAQRQIGGQTGDVLGAAQQLADIGFLIFVVIADPLCLTCSDIN